MKRFRDYEVPPIAFADADVLHDLDQMSSAVRSWLPHLMPKTQSLLMDPDNYVGQMAENIAEELADVFEQVIELQDVLTRVSDLLTAARTEIAIKRNAETLHVVVGRHVGSSVHHAAFLSMTDWLGDILSIFWQDTSVVPPVAIDNDTTLCSASELKKNLPNCKDRVIALATQTKFALDEYPDPVVFDFEKVQAIQLRSIIPLNNDYSQLIRGSGPRKFERLASKNAERDDRLIELKRARKSIAEIQLAIKDQFHEEMSPSAIDGAIKRRCLKLGIPIPILVPRRS